MAYNLKGVNRHSVSYYTDPPHVPAKTPYRLLKQCHSYSPPFIPTDTDTLHIHTHIQYILVVCTLGRGTGSSRPRYPPHSFYLHRPMSVTHPWLMKPVATHFDQTLLETA